jgi:tRNA (guanine-N7-)-methyltransferase
MRGAPGRPTPQRPTDERPRFRERSSEGRREDVNPHIAAHREFAGILMTATEASGWRDRWAERFGRDAPLHLEIGSGNGEWIAAMARQHPDWDFVGVELRYKRTVLTAHKLRKAGVANAVVCRYHAAYLDDLFDPGTLAGLHVNHPDPWPKTAHEKNRLVSRWFLEDVAALLAPGGVFRLKSDFRPNVDRVEELLAGLPLSVSGRAEDVTRGPAPWEDDVETNYQSKFRKRGLPVHAIELLRT